MLFFFVIFIRVIPLPAWVVLAYWFVVQLISGWSQLTPLRPEISGGVAFWAHIGGFLAGVADSADDLGEIFAPGIGQRVADMPSQLALTGTQPRGDVANVVRW